MNDQIKNYELMLVREKKKIEGDIARLQRSLARVEQKLSDVERAFSRDSARGSVKLRRALGENIPKRPQPKKGSHLFSRENLAVPVVEEVEKKTEIKKGFFGTILGGDE